MSDSTARLNEALSDRYRIERKVGEGGMASVYLAEDLKHNRKVAIKVLKPELAAVVGSERFLAEIKTTANLQHPHILPLHDSGEAEGLLWYVMPYLEGETLRDRVEREKQLPVDEAVALTMKVADALDHAHGRGVVHRDVKPANVLLSDRGEPLVADFGIALAVSAAGGQRVTETGLSMGTPHYMSPEQASGDRDVDPRSDIYSLGCVLYELLTGQPPFTGGTAQAILAKILTADTPDVREGRSSVPPNVATAIARALERLPADRFATARDFAAALADPTYRGPEGTQVLTGETSVWKARFWGMAAVAGALASVSVILALGPDPEPPSPVRFTEVFRGFPQNPGLAVAPDGSALVIAGGDAGTWVRDFSDTSLRPLGIQGGNPRYWPDGSRLTLQVAPRLWGWVPAGGGPLVTFPSPGLVRPLVGDDGYLYGELADVGGIGRSLPAAVSVDTVLVDGPMASGGRVRLVLPGRRGVLFTHPTSTGAALAALDPRTGEVADLMPVEGPRTFGGVAYDPSGTLLYGQGRYLVARPFDARTLEFTDEGVPVAEVSEGLLTFVYAGGTLVFGALGGTTGLPPVIQARTGLPRPLPGLPDGEYDDIDVSPDGTRIAFGLEVEGGSGVWSYVLPDGPLTPVSQGAGASAPRWLPDSRTLVYLQGGDAYRRPSDGTLPEEEIVDVEATLSRVVPGPDGRKLYLQEQPGQWDIRVVDLEDRGNDRLLFADTASWEGHPDVSPDGRWIAYYSSESGQNEVFIRSLEGPPVRRQVSRNGGELPRWSAGGDRLYFIAEVVRGTRRLMEARLRLADGEIDVLGVDTVLALGGAGYDLLPGDSLFVLVPPSEHENESEMTVVLHFDQVIRRALGRR